MLVTGRKTSLQCCIQRECQKYRVRRISGEEGPTKIETMNDGGTSGSETEPGMAHKDDDDIIQCV